jgi:hypothetical protein
MKKLVFKKWVEMLVIVMLSVGIVGFLFSCLGGLQKAALICNGITLFNILLLCKYGRTFKEEE